MNIAYVRVSVAEQNEELQVEKLKKYDIDKWFIEKVSAKDSNRPKFKEMMDSVKYGDIVYVCDFSKLARNTTDLYNIIESLNAKKVQLICSNESFDTSSPLGKLMFTMIGTIAEFERELILERQREGIVIAKEKGLYKGRKRIEYKNVAHFEIYYQKYLRRELNKVQMAKLCKVSRVVLDRLIDEYKADLEG